MDLILKEQNHYKNFFKIKSKIDILILLINLKFFFLLFINLLWNQT